MNRWGQLLFETSATTGRGWDGHFNGKDQPQDVYIYQIALTLRDGRSEQYQGNVTLLK